MQTKSAIPTALLILSVIIIHIHTCRSSVNNSDGWQAAADFLLDGIDTTVDPCNNFYQYTCRGWERKYGGQSTPEIEKPQKALIDGLLTSIKNIDEDDSDTPLYQKRLKIFFDQCMNSPRDYDDILLSIYNLTVKRIGSMPLLDPSGARRYNPYYLIGMVQRMFNIQIFVRATVSSSPDKCASVPQLTLVPPPELGYGSMQFWGGAINTTFPARLVKLGSGVGVNLDERDVAKRINAMLSYEANITGFLKPMRPFKTVSHRLSRLGNDLNANVDWRALFRGLIPKRIMKSWSRNDPELLFYSPEYFTQLDTFLQQLDYHDLFNYAYVSLLYSYMQNYMDTSGYLHLEVTPFTEEFCLEHVVKHARPAATLLHFERITQKPDRRNIANWKRDIELLAEAVFSAFRYLVQSADWLDAEGKGLLIKKVNTIGFFSGIPRWMLNETAVLAHTPPYQRNATIFENDLTMFSNKFEWTLEQLLIGIPWTETVEKGYVSVAYTTEDPYFAWHTQYGWNQVRLWMGTSLPPLYNYSYPLPVKFGALGWLIGWELLRAFDVKASERQEERERWLKNIKEYEKRTNCIRQQYSAFCNTERNFCESGEDALQQAITAMEGMKVAFMAYKFAIQTAGHMEHLPGMEQFSFDQLFFITAGRLLCGVGGAESAKDAEYMLIPSRLDLALMNFPAFARAFNCPVGAKFAPLQTCTLWGDFLEPNIDQVKMNRTVDEDEWKETWE